MWSLNQSSALYIVWEVFVSCLLSSRLLSPTNRINTWLQMASFSLITLVDVMKGSKIGISGIVVSHTASVVELSKETCIPARRSYWNSRIEVWSSIVFVLVCLVFNKFCNKVRLFITVFSAYFWFSLSYTFLAFSLSRATLNGLSPSVGARIDSTFLFTPFFTWSSLAE